MESKIIKKMNSSIFKEMFERVKAKDKKELKEYATTLDASDYSDAEKCRLLQAKALILLTEPVEKI